MLFSKGTTRKRVHKEKKCVNYTYDALNRILSATSNDDKYNVSGITYDKAGNILSLDRQGHLNDAASSFGNMDILSYTYDTGNKLLKVADIGNKTYGFKDGTNTNDDFEYDANGNLTIDRNKGITSILYNHMNLPTTVSVAGANNGTINYVYDATGAKLKKVATESGNATTTEYAGGYIYKNGNLEYFGTSEGYVTPENGGYQYVYQFKDHLQNVRLSYTDADNNGTIDPNTEIISEKNYYPFGLTHKGYNGNVSSLGNSTAQLRGFGGKEEQNELGLGWIDITARNYDPALGRWMNLDPLAEQMRRHSPYNYAFDNPIYFIDPDGMKPFGGWNPISGIGEGIASAVATAINDAAEAVSDFFTVEDDFEGGGLMISDGSNSSSGDQNMIRKATREQAKDVEMIDADPILNNMTKFAKAPGAKNKPKGDGRTKATKKAKPNLASETKRGIKDGKKIVKRTEQVHKITKEARASINSNNTEPDTTVTATFAGGIDTVINREDGTFVISSEKDSTVTINKSQVQSFNNNAAKSIQNQNEEIERLQDNN
ncbi:RHS repeat-associated core domain-containing protein [Aquimarina sp. 2201CG1-2-11]|uniref:RHS repeat domain-containing protein n=1 Tax=Aquimarina discodermiae TaxID=3231043 RepID=UPI003463155B